MCLGVFSDFDAWEFHPLCPFVKKTGKRELATGELPFTILISKGHRIPDDMP